MLVVAVVAIIQIQEAMREQVALVVAVLVQLGLQELLTKQLQEQQEQVVGVVDQVKELHNHNLQVATAVLVS
jgi:Asp-tRNA(Asn)/Glu-tRNA(Gln) amidotransferase C subunit